MECNNETLLMGYGTGRYLSATVSGYVMLLETY